ncbi:MAG: hypothetical protein WCK75_10850 [Elusimicrobiota bacterium]
MMNFIYDCRKGPGLTADYLTAGFFQPAGVIMAYSDTKVIFSFFAHAVIF